jgi:periplasmic protein TonB
MTLNLDAINQERHTLSAIFSMCLVALVFSMAQSFKGPAELVAQEVMELTTTLIEPLFEKPKPPEVRPEPKPKNISPAPTPTPAPRQEIKQEMMVPAETTRAAPPQTAAPIAQTTPVAPLAPVAQATPEIPKPAAPQVPASVSLENNYIASVRSTLNANKRYPTGREASLQRPAGKVKIAFVLARNGSLVEASVEESSNSIILDNAALATVRRTNYAPWPDGSWPSQSQHKFTVSLDFVPLN